MICYLLVGNKYRLGDALLSIERPFRGLHTISRPSGTGLSCLSFQALRARLPSFSPDGTQTLRFSTAC